MTGLPAIWCWVWQSVCHTISGIKAKSFECRGMSNKSLVGEFSCMYLNACLNVQIYE